MERETDRNLDGLRAVAVHMGSLSEAILNKSLRSVWDRNPTLAAEVASDDLEIDRLDIEIDNAILRLLALRAPVARDLRVVLATKSLATDLERVGDLARNIAECAIRIAKSADARVTPSLRDLADESARLLRNSLAAYASTDSQLARRVIADDDRVDAGEERVRRELHERCIEHPEEIATVIDCISIASSLERVGDHATNIAEDVVLVSEALNLKHASKVAAAGGRGSGEGI